MQQATECNHLNLSIQLEVRDVYGRVLYYPACKDSARLCDLAGTKTLSQSSIAIIKALGYKVKAVNSVMEIL